MTQAVAINADETSPEAARARPVEAPRVPSYDFTAEKAILEAALVEPDLAIDLAARVRSSDFFAGPHVTIWRAVEELVAANRPVSEATVGALLRERGKLAQIGGSERLADLTMVPATRGRLLDDAVKQVRDRANVRRIAGAAARIAADGLGATDPAAYLDGARKLLDGIGADLDAPASCVALLDGAALAARLPELSYFIADLGMVAGGGAPHMVAGFGFSGKTIAMQSMAVSLASGTPIWGYYRVPSPLRVLHVDLEQGDRLTRRRYQRLAVAMGIDLAGLGDRLSVAIMPGLSLVEADAPRWRELMTGRDVIIIDSLRAATAGLDENSSEIRASLDLLGRLSEATGCRPIVIHHSRKPSEDAPGGRYAIRGSGAIYDACDAVYTFAAAKGEPVSVETVKARSHGDLADDIALVIEDVEHDGDPKAGLRVTVRGGELVAERRAAAAEHAKRAREAADAETIRRAIAAHPGIAARELRAVTGLGGDRTAAALLVLADAVHIVEERSGRARTVRHYLRHDGGDR